jgi:hypothetical protein
MPNEVRFDIPFSSVHLIKDICIAAIWVMGLPCGCLEARQPDAGVKREVPMCHSITLFSVQYSPGMFDSLPTADEIFGTADARRKPDLLFTPSTSLPDQLGVSYTANSRASLVAALISPNRPFMLGESHKPPFPCWPVSVNSCALIAATLPAT